MLPITIKQVLLTTTLSTTLIACGGGGDDSSEPITPPATNAAPVINSFTAQVNNNDLTVVYNWSVSDANQDALSCELQPGGTLASITINDCLTTTSATVDYASFNSYTAGLTVSDPSNETANKSLTVALQAATLPEPVVTAGENQLVFFYNRADGDYTGWVLHLWNNESCDSYADLASDEGTDWATGQAHTDIDPNYGAYWLIDLKADYADCANIIVHKGDVKDIGDTDLNVDLTGERMIWALSGVNELYTQPTLLPNGVLIADSAAHWAKLNTLFWDLPASDISTVRVYSSSVADLGYNSETGITGDNFIEFAPQATNTANSLNLPRYSELSTFEATAPDADKAKNMLTGKLLAIAYDQTGTVLAATYVQTPRVIDDLYTQATDDADEATLGLVYSSSDITTSLWAPTAQAVNLQVFNAAKELQASHPMTRDSETGIWSFALPLTNDRLFYRYELTVYHHQTLNFETLWSTDPYSVSLSTNGLYSQFVNLDDADLKPMGWDDHTIPTIGAIEDAVIYEGHIRNFSIRDESTSAENRGKYLAFTEEDSAPVQHLKSLTEAGLTHFQILPANDIASINEDESQQVNLTSTVANLCAINSSAPVCGVEDENATLQSVLENYDPASNQAQALAQTLRGLDGYNWGYDPKHFNAPEGSYSTNPDGTNRILEMREMVQALHEMGLRTSIDVVYNHTSATGLWENSVLDKVVPGYYYRRDLTSGKVRNETCCEDTESEHVMMNKLMTDSLVLWADKYKFDAFRFDIMGSHSKDSILTARTAVTAIDPDTYFYGEGWTRTDQGYEQAAQNQMAGSEVGTFNDRPRDIIREASLFNSSKSLNEQDIIRLGLAGTLQDYQLQDSNGNISAGKSFSKPSYAKDPADIINYVSKHDGEALWDLLQYGLSSDLSVTDRVRSQNIAATLPLLSQGIPFLQAGGDLIRSKSMDTNSYDSGDWFNLVDFTKTTNNWNVGLPLAENNETNWSNIGDVIANSETQVQPSDIVFAGEIFKEFLAIRHSSPLFKLTTAQDIFDRVGFHNTGTTQTKGLIVMSIDDGTGLTDLDANYDAVVVVINGTEFEQSHTVSTANGFTLHSVQQTSADTTVQAASFVESTNTGTFTVPALTTAVFVKMQAGSQGSGLSAGITRDAPDVAPYGNNSLYIRGSMNNNGADGFVEADNFSYDGNGVYNLTYTLEAGEQNFTITSDDSVAVNLGYNDVNITSNDINVTNDNGNFSFSTSATGSYSFALDASSTTPTLSISSKSPTVNCTALTDSTDANPFTVAGDGELYIKGDHSGWGADEDYRLHYKGDNVYQAVADFDGDMQFKLASSDGSWTTQLWAQANDSIMTQDLTIGISYPVAYNNAGEQNNSASLPAGSYSFLLTLNEANPSQGNNVGSLIIQQCQP